MDILFMMILSAFASAIPAFGYLVFVWWMDRYDREPIHVVALAFAWGAIGAAGLSLVVSSILMIPVSFIVSPQVSLSFAAIVIAPIVEELTKGIILVVLVFHRKFDGLVDGMVYGAAVGLGFALSENFLYYMSSYVSGGFGVWMATVFARTTCATMTHVVASSAFGAAIGAVKYTHHTWLKWVAPPMGLMTALLVHAVYNAGAVTAQIRGDASWFALAVIILAIELLIGFIVIQIALWGESRSLQRELASEVDTGVLSEEHYRIVPSWWRRVSFLLDDLTAYGRRSHFLRLATDLAIRKEQAPFYDGEERRAAEAEITNIREKLKEVRSAMEGV